MAKKVTNQEFADIVNSSTTMTQVIIALDYSGRDGKTRKMLKAKIARLGLSMSHFTMKGIKHQKRTLAEILVENSPVTNQGGSGNRILEQAMKQAYGYSCAMCGNGGEWNGQPLKLHKDHISGNNKDNRLENLRFLCPNCHQQTDTWGKGGNKVREVSKSEVSTN